MFLWVGGGNRIPLISLNVHKTLWSDNLRQVGTYYEGGSHWEMVGKKRDLTLTFLYFLAYETQKYIT